MDLLPFGKGTLIVNECIFCKIIRGELPSSTVFENEEVIAFLDIMPLSKGHTLVVPKTHSENLETTPAEIMMKLGPVLKKLSRAVTEATGASAVNLLLSNGKAAGQIVPHLHFHIIPRTDDDGMSFETKRRKYTGEEMENYRNKIVAALK